METDVVINKIETLDELFKIKSICVKVYALFKYKPPIKNICDFMKVESLLNEYKHCNFKIRNIDSEAYQYIMETDLSGFCDDSRYLEPFLTTISVLDLNESQLSQIKEKFSYSKIYKLFKKLIVTQKYRNHRVIYLIIKIINNSSLCFNSLLPVISRINNYLKKGVDKNFIPCITILRAVAEEGTIIEGYSDYFTSLVSFLVDVVVEPKNFVFFHVDEIEQLVETIEKLVRQRGKNARLANISIGIFLKLQEKLFENVDKEYNDAQNMHPVDRSTKTLPDATCSKIVFASPEEQLAFGCQLKVMTIIYDYTYESGCRMYDYSELFQCVLTFESEIGLAMCYKYEFLDVIYNDYTNEISKKASAGNGNKSPQNSTVRNKSLESIKKYRPSQSETNSNITLIDYNTTMSIDAVSITDERFTEILVHDLKKSNEIARILEKISNLTKLINLPILINFAIENYKDFIKFIGSNKFADSEEAYLFVKYITSTGDEDSLLLFSFYLSLLENVNNYMLLILLLSHNSDGYFDDSRIRKRIFLIFKIILKLDMNEFFGFFVENIFKLDLVLLSLIFSIFEKIDSNYLPKLTNFVLKNLACDTTIIKNLVLNDEKCQILPRSCDSKLYLSLLAFVLVRREIDPLDLNIEMSYPFLIVTLLYEIKKKDRRKPNVNDEDVFNNEKNNKKASIAACNSNNEHISNISLSKRISNERLSNQVSNEISSKKISNERLFNQSPNMDKKLNNDDLRSNIKIKGKRSAYDDRNKNKSHEKKVDFKNEPENEIKGLHSSGESLKFKNINSKNESESTVVYTADTEYNSSIKDRGHIPNPDISVKLKNSIIHFLIVGSPDEVCHIKLLYMELIQNKALDEKSKFLSLYEEIERIYSCENLE